MEQKRDKYDEAIDNLLLLSNCIRNAWITPSANKNGCLFQFMTKTGSGGSVRRYGYDISFGCVSQIHSEPGVYISENDELTEAIINDKRIPNEVNEETTREQLEVFAEYQRKADVLFERK